MVRAWRGESGRPGCLEGSPDVQLGPDDPGLRPDDPASRCIFGCSRVDLPDHLDRGPDRPARLGLG